MNGPIFRVANTKNSQSIREGTITLTPTTLVTTFNLLMAFITIVTKDFLEVIEIHDLKAIETTMIRVSFCLLTIDMMYWETISGGYAPPK